MLNVILYTRKDCHLCDQVKTDLQALREKYPHRLIEVDIEADPALLKAYLIEIPVLEIGPYKIKAPITRESLAMTLGAASDRRSQLQQVGDPQYQARLQKGQVISGLDRFSFWLSRHYLALVNIFMLIYVGLPVSAPALMRIGAVGPAQAIHKIYSPLCHQFGFRSFYLFGEQFYYPLAEAKLSGVKTFEQATGIMDVDDPTSYDRLRARAFVGNEIVGYKMALCERDVGIYGAMVLFGLFFSLSRRRAGSLHWMIWLLIGIGPIGLDGFSQLFSQFNWPLLSSLLPYRESTPLLRVLTGALFGFFTAWFAYPNIEESMRETRQFYIKKFAVVNGL